MKPSVKNFSAVQLVLAATLGLFLAFKGIAAPPATAPAPTTPPTTVVVVPRAAATTAITPNAVVNPPASATTPATQSATPLPPPGGAMAPGPVGGQIAPGPIGGRLTPGVGGALTPGQPTGGAFIRPTNGLAALTAGSNAVPGSTVVIAGANTMVAPFGALNGALGGTSGGVIIGGALPLGGSFTNDFLVTSPGGVIIAGAPPSVIPVNPGGALTGKTGGAFTNPAPALR